MSAALLLASPRNGWICLSLSSTNLSPSSKCSRGDKSAFTLSSTYICNRRPPSSHLFFSFVVRVQKCQICHTIWTNIGGNEIYEKHSVQMKGFLVNVVIYFFLLQNNEYPAQLSFSRCEFTGWRVSNGRRATTTPNVKSNNKLCTLALLVSAVRSLQCGES